MLRKTTFIFVIIATMLVFVGCSANAEISNKVYNAAISGDYKTVEEILEKNDVDLEHCNAAEEEMGDGRILAGVIAQAPEDIKMCSLLIKYGAELESTNSYGATYFHEFIDSSEAVAATDYTEVMKLFLESGKDVNAKGKKTYKETPLDYLMTKSSIITANYDKIFNLLIDNGAEVTQNTLECCMYGDSGFMYASKILKMVEECGVSETLEAVIADKEDKAVIELVKAGKYADDEKQLITFFAAANCGAAVIKTLEEEGFYMDIHAENDMSLLDIAAAYNTTEVVEYLLEKGYDPKESFNSVDEDVELSEEESNLNLRQSASKPSSYTPISFALVMGNTEVVDLLIQKGLNFQENSWCIAAFHGGKKAVDILLKENYVQEDYFIANCYIMCSDEMVKYLLDQNVDYNVEIYNETLEEFLIEIGNKERYDLIEKYSM